MTGFSVPDSPAWPAPAYIPVEVCSAVGLDFSTPLPDCLARVEADVAARGVAAPAADVAGLVSVVGEAAERGIDLKVVVMATSPPIDTPLRDVATLIGREHPDSTVLVLSPGWAGTYSTGFDRVQLEAGQDVAKTAPNPVAGAQNFLDQLTTPIFPWSALTIALVAAVAGAVAAVRFMQRSANSRARGETGSQQA